MSMIKLKNIPKIKLMDLLRRRKTTLLRYLDEFGITTYESLNERCDRMGVTSPSLEEFVNVRPLPPVVNSPTEGVVVINPISERSEEKITIDTTEEVITPDIETQSELHEVESIIETSDFFKKKSRKRKEFQSNE